MIVNIIGCLSIVLWVVWLIAVFKQGKNTAPVLSNQTGGSTENIVSIPRLREEAYLTIGHAFATQGKVEIDAVTLLVLVETVAAAEGLCKTCEAYPDWPPNVGDVIALREALECFSFESSS